MYQCMHFWNKTMRWNDRIQNLYGYQWRWLYRMVCRYQMFFWHDLLGWSVQENVHERMYIGGKTMRWNDGI